MQTLNFAYLNNRGGGGSIIRNTNEGTVVVGYVET